MACAAVKPPADTPNIPIRFPAWNAASACFPGGISSGHRVRPLTVVLLTHSTPAGGPLGDLTGLAPLWVDELGEVAVGAVVMVLRGRFRQYWKSWLALSVLVAVAGGFVLATASAGHRTAGAFARFTARYGYDTIVYSGHRLTGLTRLPRVSTVTPALVTISGRRRLRVLP